MSSPVNPSNEDDSLLSRLRALRPNTTVSFTNSPREQSTSTQPPPSISQTLPDQPHESPDALLSRFQSLYGPQIKSLPEQSDEFDTEDVDFDEDEQSLDELLAALQEDQSWGFYDGKGEGQEEVREAKGAIRDVLRDLEEMRRRGEGVEEINDEGETNGESSNIGGEGQAEAEENKPSEDEEANEIMQKVMAELSLESDPANGDDQTHSNEETPEAHHAIDADGDADGDADLDFDLPSAPSTQPVLADFSLPSTPSSLPQPRSKPQAKAPPKFSDEEVASWCIICLSDGSVTCLDCDGDIYCERCWMEGHKGEGAGMEERRHRARRIVKHGPGDGDQGGGKKERRKVYAS